MGIAAHQAHMPYFIRLKHQSKTSNLPAVPMNVITTAKQSGCNNSLLLRVIADVLTDEHTPEIFTRRKAPRDFSEGALDLNFNYYTD
jgi:hypothetical protein